MTMLRLIAFRFFALMLVLWTGAGLHESLSGHFGWWADPVAYVAAPPPPGMINAWPFTTMTFLLATVTAAICLRGYAGEGKREAVIALAGAGIVLAATLGFFVPQLAVVGDPSLDADALVATSRRWIALNALRTVVLLVLGWYALIALARFTPARSAG